MSETLKCRVNNQVAIITLDEEKSLNALSLDMAKKILKSLATWNMDPNIKLIILEGAGDRAFCAGGDIVRLYKSKDDPNDNYPDVFFSYEYRLDYSIYLSKKPVLVWGNGIVMGGGIGLMSGAAFRIVTEKTKMAMPELGIGLFPDVGGSFFLSRIPHNVGKFLAFSGERINAGDALYTGQADFFIASEYKQKLYDYLIEKTPSISSESLKNQLGIILMGFMRDSKDLCPESLLQKHENEIEKAMSGDTVSELYLNFTKAASENDYFKRGLEYFKQGSPTSAAVCWEQLKRGQKMNLKEAFQMELVLAYHFSRGRDFFEGVRALLIDKDKEPKWEFNDISEVSAQTVAKYFDSPWTATEHPLADLPT